MTNAGRARLTYEIAVQPVHGTASIDTDGTITYTAANYIGDDRLVVAVSDGTNTVDATVDIALQAEPVFDYQFYRVENPEVPGTWQIVRYDPNDDNPASNQVVVKQGAILSNKVFVMSGAKTDDSMVYLKREYAVFQERGAFEVRQTSDETPVEYAFYSDTVLKTFDASNTNAEKVIYRGSMLSDEMKAQGVAVLGTQYKLYTTESDIDNSYVQLKAFDSLPDLLRSEHEGEKTQLPLVVRISDSTAVVGRMIAPIVNSSGAVEKVLINEVGAYTDDTLDSVAKTLKVCNAALVSCKPIPDSDGVYYLLARNDAMIYMARAGEQTIYAYSVADDSVSVVTGVQYPAPYDGIHHQIAYNGGHGGSGIFSNLYNMPGVVDTLSDGDISYLLINYNLDTQDPAGEGRYSSHGMDPYVHKNAMVLTLTGTRGRKVYDNGTGIDLMNESDDIVPSYNMSLAAVKNGHLFLEASRFNGSETKDFHYLAGWLDTNTETTKTDLDNTLIDKDISYFTSIRVPPVAVGEHIYVNEDTYLNGETSGSSNRVYNVYKIPIDNPALTKEDPAVEHVTGRMYFERSAYRTSGIYNGNVLLWDRHNKGMVINATTGEIMGVATEDVDERVSNVVADRVGNRTLAGIGGLFGLHMTTTHGGTPFLVSGQSAAAGSLKSANQINGSWIID
ncbi:MAG: hypothetical protein CSA52_00105 [Gammaproteobacteria bacterium]|nr:MAG: hypothetical protein CSB48_06995 [Pseudomonadota bacterium]PIE38987.1 MAG: hypothetical protein CSA52_00105 [Gammaproteobacteria bacterium]